MTEMLDVGTVDAFAAKLHGSVTRAGDADYDEVRALYNAMIDKRPALIARCAGPDDVVRAVRFAREEDLLLAVRGGGHNGAGLGTCDGGVVIDLSALEDVQVDPQARTVRVGGGCTWGQVDRATGEHGLATPSGIITAPAIMSHRSVTAVCSRWRSVSGSASIGGGRSPIRNGRSGRSRVTSPPPVPSAARSSSGSTTRARWSSAWTNGPYGVRTTASQPP